MDGGGGKIVVGHNKEKTKKLDWPHSKRRLPCERNNRGKNGWTKSKRKTKTKTPRLDDEGGIQGTERGGSTTRRVVPLDVRTCHLAENMTEGGS